MGKRGLSPLEEAEARLIFADGILYSRVCVVENASWTNVVPRLRIWLGDSLQPAADNAIAIGHTAYFPRELRSSALALADGQIGDLAWLIHELTHTWQAERMGARYALQALGLHLRGGRGVYSYGGETAILAAIEAGRGLSAFNVEQQAEIARDCYIRRRLGMGTEAWEPLIAEFRTH
jgi:hypothetical protein